MLTLIENLQKERGLTALMAAFQSSSQHNIHIAYRGLDPRCTCGCYKLGGYMFARAHAVVLPYTDFEAQSGVLHTAIEYGVPVIVSW